jgi:response regulator RpfG family c-di-GMP phosphodiesterase
MTGNYLIVGDSTTARESLAVLLRSRGNTVTLAPSGTDAIRSLRESPVDTVLIVCGENDIAAQQLRNRILLENRALRTILVSPIVSGDRASKVARLGIGDYRLSESEFLALVGTHDGRDGQEGTSPSLSRGVKALIEVVNVLVGVRELNDVHHRGSAHRSSYLARAVAERMKLDEKEVLEIVLATLLRDVGKVEIQDLDGETGVFSESQRIHMQEHVAASVRLLEHIDFPWTVLPTIRHHHEHYDGTGYPDGLRGPEIPLGSRIIGAVDAYLAMLSDRPHRACRSSSEAQTELVREAGRHFDPEVVEVLLQVIREGAVSLSADEKPRVLIAEPEVEFVKLLKFRLVNEGMDVDSVSSLEEGLLRILEKPPSIVIAAIGSDQERTLDLLRQIREDSSLRMLPIVLLAETESRVFKVRAFRAGADDCLLKTSGLEEIVARIDGILSREAMRGSRDDRPRQRGITGQLENLALPDIFQILNLGLKTARVTLESGGSGGTIWFNSGAAVHAEAGERVGAEACFEMLRWKQGSFCIEHGLQTDQTSIEMDTMFMVMEGLRQVDESATSEVDETLVEDAAVP